MSLENLKSIFQDELQERVESFKSVQPIDRFDTKLNYNENPFNESAFTFSADLTQRGGRDNPLLDSILRGRAYEPIRFSQDFVNDNLFVKPENAPFNDEKISQDSLGLFDPRSTTPKLDTLYFNVNNSFNPATDDGQITFQTAGGVDKGISFPYSRLADLGKEFISEGLSYQVLYNDDHTPKNGVVYQGQSPISYQNVNRDNLKIGNRDRVIGGQYGFDRGDEPYVISPIGNEGRELNKGGRSVPLTRALTDGDRILNFLLSEQGIAFILQQNINIPIENTVVRGGDKNNELIRRSQRFGVTYNPLSTLAASAARALGQAIPNVLIRKSGFDLFGNVLEGVSSLQSKLKGGATGETAQSVADLLNPQEYGPSATNAGFSINDTFTAGDSTGGGGILSQLGNALSSLNPFDGGTKVPKTSAGDRVTLSHMIHGTDLDNVFRGTNVKNIKYTEFKATGGDEEEDVQNNAEDILGYNPEEEKHGMPFYFKDLRDNTYIFFRAFIEGLTENISPSYASHNYVGRSEPVYTYERAEREISFTLKLVANTEFEMNSIYEKMDRLTSLCYPAFLDEGGPTSFGNRMKPPLTKFRYGELFGKRNQELMGYIKSISYSVEQTSPYETNEIRHIVRRKGLTGKIQEVTRTKKARAPKHITATIGYQVIHDISPRLSEDFRFYGINQRQKIIVKTSTLVSGIGNPSSLDPPAE